MCIIKEIIVGMKRFLWCFGLVLLSAVQIGIVYAQSSNPIKFGIRLDPDKITYRVFMTSTVSLTGNQARVVSAQVTVRIEDPSRSNVFSFTNLTGNTFNGQQMVWTANGGQVENPPSNGSTLPYDYISFGNSAQTSSALFNISANTEIELFSFQRNSPCAGAVSIFVNTGTEDPSAPAPNNTADPFNMPNELRTTPGNAITILGLGQSSAYGGNFTGFVYCQNGIPDLTLSITGPSTLTANTTSTFVLSANNSGAAATTGVISITTVLPQGLTYNGSFGAAWGCTSTTLGNGNTQVVCSSNTSIAASGASSLSLNLTATSTLASATFSAMVLGGGETNTANNTASKSVTVVAGPSTDLTFSLLGSSNLTAGVASSYTALVTNIGAATSSGTISTTVLLPNGFSYSAGSGAGWTVNSTTLGNGNVQIVGTTAASIGAGATGAFTFLAIPPSAAGSGTFGGVVVGGGETNTANNTTSFPFTISQSGTISLSTSISGPASVAAGNAGSYLINVNNTGSAATSGPVTITFTIPAGMSYSSYSGAGWSISSAFVNGQTVYTAALSGGISAGGSAAGLTVNLQANANAGGTSVNFSGAANTVGQTGLANGFTQAIAITSNATSSDLSATLNGPGTMQAGSGASYTLTINNLSSTPTNGPVSTTFTLPAGVSLSGYAGTGWTVTSAVVGGVTVYSAVQSSVISGASSSPPLQLNLVSASNASSGNISGMAIWSGDPNPANNSISLPITVQSGAPSFAASLSGPSSLTVGTASTVIVSLTNTGSGATTGPTTATFSLPTGVQLNNYNAPAGTTINSFVQPDGSTSITVTYTSPIPAGSSPPQFSLIFTPISSTLAGTTIYLTGGVRSSNMPNPSPVSQSYFVVSNQPAYPADLSGTLSGPSTLTAGVSGSYTLAMTNTGLGSTTGPITTTLSLPTGVNYAGFTGAGWSVSSAAGPGGTTILTAVYSSTIGSGGSPTPLILNVTAGVALAGSNITLSGGISTPGESNTGNNGVSAGLSVVSSGGGGSGQSANLSTTVQITNGAPNQYEATTARIVVTNSGPNPATNVVSQVSLPAGNPITSMSASGGSFNSGTGIWSVGTLAPGQSVTLTVTFSAATGGIATVSNEIISSSLPDPNSTPNNHATSEDDQAQACFSVPITLCSGQLFVASLNGVYTTIQWYRNNTPIQGATGNQLTINQSGTYSVVTNAPCQTGACCPIIVRDGDCCQIPVCVPITISRRR